MCLGMGTCQALPVHERDECFVCSAGWGPAQQLEHVVSHAKGMFYDYNDRDSEAIWCYSCSYEGKACE